jgi:pyruvate/2-oxoglutarate dehydrogenase complex dihydrolipoamide dehydrogenase (E3) component
MSRRASYDFVVIGGGSAGYNGARTAAKLGLRTAVVEGARRMGGLCILRGCMPSKTLIYAAEILHNARSAADYGLRVSDARPDMAAVQARKRRIIADFARHRIDQLETGDFDLIRAYARFSDPHTLELSNGKRITSKSFLIATGSRVSVPGLPGLANSGFVTSDEILDLASLPASILVLGGGIVACELAQFLARMGTKVTLIQRSAQLLRCHSAEAAKVVRAAFEHEGIHVWTKTEVRGIRRSARGTAVEFRHRGRTVERRAEMLLNALGREPDVGRLNLPAAGVKLAEKGRIRTNRWQQTTAPHIYAGGDCCGPHEIVHVAILQGELAARHAAGVRGIRPVAETPLLSVIFTDPQVASIGAQEEELIARKEPYLSASHPFSDHGKSILMNAAFGFVKAIADPKSGRILGAEIVGKDAGELIHSFTSPISMRATVADMLRAPWYHPTLSEIVTYPLEMIAEKLG